MPFEATAVTGADLLLTRQMQGGNATGVHASVTDFTLRMNPSSDALQTQANEDNGSALDNRPRTLLAGGSVR